MKKQHVFLSVILFISHNAVVLADEITDKKNAKLTTALMSEAHSVGPSSVTKDQPFWSKQQTRQAELEIKYKNEIAENPDNKQVYTYLAGLYLTNNKTSKAIDAYQDAITHNPENPKLFAGISIAYLHQSKFAMARAMADEALRLDPSLTQVEKINEYIVAKEAAIEAASMLPTKNMENTEKQRTGSGAAPIDAMHGAKSSTVRINDPLSWTETH